MATALKLSYGLLDNRLVHVLAVLNGLACGCTCPSCGARLVARNQGQKKAAHFAHYEAPECTYGLQTALHLAAKDIFLKHRKLLLPGAVGEVQLDATYWQTFSFDAKQYLYHLPCEVFEENLYEFPSRYTSIQAVVLERKTDNIIPDIVVETENGPLLVEIAVTHFIDEAKLKKFGFWVYPLSKST